MRLFLILLFSAAISFSAGAYSGIEYGAVGTIYKNARYSFRTALGLEKYWISLSAKVARSKYPAVTCPDPAESVTIVTGGQSNAANSITKKYLSEPRDEVYSWYRGKCYVARDPVPGATGWDGSLWPSLGVEIGRAMDRPVVLINGAVSTSQFGDWIDLRSGYLDALLANVSEAQASGFEPRLILWDQGETDAGTKFDPAKLKSEIEDLTGQLLEAMPESKLYLFRTSKCRGDGREKGVPEIRDLQTLVASENDRMIIGMNTDELGDDYRWDMCHFNSLGRAAIVSQVAPEVAANLYPGGNLIAGD